MYMHACKISERGLILWHVGGQEGERERERERERFSCLGNLIYLHQHNYESLKSNTNSTYDEIISLHIPSMERVIFT